MLPSAARGQQTSAIAGVMRDTSEAVLPGVTVEAASPAVGQPNLITDGRIIQVSGQLTY